MSQKLFISYRRKSWPFTHRLAEDLRQRLDAEIFVDFQGIDETDFEHAILKNLRASDAVLLVVSESTFEDRIHHDDDWVRREIREALDHDKPLILVCVDGLLPPPGLPDDIKDVARMQGFNFYPEFFTPAVDRLAEFVVTVGASGWRSQTTAPSESEPDEKKIDKATLDEALDLLESEDFHKAIFLLESLQEAGFKSRFVNISELLTKARDHAQQTDFRRQAELDYADIAVLAKRKITEDEARKAFAAWCEAYPDLPELDTENLYHRFSSPLPWPKTGTRRKPPSVLDILPPPFEWVKIPAGKVTLEDASDKKLYDSPGTKGGTYTVPTFEIAKYPITNAQIQVFVDAPDGYHDVQWWNYSKAAQQWRQQNELEETKFEGDDLPRTNVCWYEVIAFCQWLSQKTGQSITLPTEQQWQRAAQGDDKRIYPWGNQEPNGQLCNWGRNVGQTTPVTYYPQGASPYGVMDMSGNVWEWCLTEWGTDSVDVEGNNSRVLRGGSWADYGGFARCAFRFRDNPRIGSSRWGFRIARAIPE